MARKIMIAGNWKMNGQLEDGVNLAKAVAAEVKNLGKPACEFLVCPPFTLLYSVKKALRGAKVALGAQDAHFAVKGAHTGDISPAMLKDLECTYVILGHSERRADHFESNELVAKKAAAAYDNGLKTIICIGETEAQRDEGKTIDVCSQQIMGSVPDNADASNTVIAYEPVWAIGTGKTATADQAEEVCKSIRDYIAELYSSAVAESVRIQYGGSVKANNAREILSEPNIDGALVGGASLIVDEFNEIIMAAQEVSK